MLEVKLQALVYDILRKKVPESDARSVAWSWCFAWTTCIRALPGLVSCSVCAYTWKNGAFWLFSNENVLMLHPKAVMKSFPTIMTSWKNSLCAGLASIEILVVHDRDSATPSPSAPYTRSQMWQLVKSSYILARFHARWEYLPIYVRIKNIKTDKQKQPKSKIPFFHKSSYSLLAGPTRWYVSK